MQIFPQKSLKKLPLPSISSQVTASGWRNPSPGASGSVPQQPRQSSCSSSIKCPNDSTKWTTPNIPYLCLTWRTPQIDVHALRAKSRMTSHCLHRMCALKHGHVTPGQALSPATEGLEGAFSHRHSFPRTGSRGHCATPRPSSLSL